MTIKPHHFCACSSARDQIFLRGALRQQGTELADGEWRDSQSTGQMRSLLELTELLPSFRARQLRSTRSIHFPASIDDHLPQHYIATLTPPGEFGD